MSKGPVAMAMAVLELWWEDPFPMSPHNPGAMLSDRSGWTEGNCTDAAIDLHSGLWGRNEVAVAGGSKGRKISNQGHGAWECSVKF